MALSKKAQFVLTVISAIIIPGLADYALTSAGYKTLANIVWMSGYGFGIITIWYLWIRPLDITGPEGVQFTEDEDPQQDTENSSEGDAPSS